MTTVSIGFSIKADLDQAVAEAVRVDGDGPPCVAMLYTGVAYDQAAVLAAVRARLPTTVVVGASTQGVSLAGRAYESDRFLAVMTITSDTVTARSAAVPTIGGDARAAGLALAAQLGPAPAGPSMTIMFYDPLGGADIAALLEGMRAGGYPRLFGAGAGQPWSRMVRTYQFCDAEVYSAGAVALRIDGLEPVSDLTHGAEGIGLALTATRTDGNQVLELDGRPALDVWREQLGVYADLDAESAANWALGIRPAFDAPYEGMVTRAPFGFDEVRRSLVFQAPIPAGARVQVCVRTHEAVLGGALAMGQRLAAQLGGRTPVMAMSFECGARPAPFLGNERAAVEVCGIQAVLPAGLPWFGMYAWGELAPVGARTEFHNYTFPLVVLCEPAVRRPA